MQTGIIKVLKRYSDIYLPLFMIIACFVVAVFAPFLAPYNPNLMHTGYELLPPGNQFVLGTDEYGRDLMSRLIFGARISIGVSFASVVLSLFFGSVIGLISGYYGGLVDELAMRMMDIILAFPPILLALIIVSFFGTGTRNIVLSIAIVYLPRFARVIRAATLTTRESEYVIAARAVGSSDLRIILKHILPNIRAPILVQTSLSLSTAILFEAGLSFLGLGIQPPTPSWGRMLSEARAYMLFSPWACIFPGFAIMFLILGFNMLGDRLRDLFDPKLSKRFETH